MTIHLLLLTRLSKVCYLQRERLLQIFHDRSKLHVVRAIIDKAIQEAKCPRAHFVGSTRTLLNMDGVFCVDVVVAIAMEIISGLDSLLQS